MRLRLAQLYGGLLLYGVSSSLLVLAGLGLDPWDVFHQGLARHTPFAIGTWAILVGAVVLLLWIPLRQRPGIQSRRTTAPTRIAHVPIANGVCRARPWWKTSHG